MRRPSLLALSLLAALACQRGPSASPNDAGTAESRVEDAQALPGFAAESSEGTEVAAASEIERYYVPLDDAPVRGPDDAAVTVVMFSDFECPFCLRGHEIMNALRERYPSSVRVAYKAFPLDMHPHALLAAMAARSAQSQG